MCRIETGEKVLTEADLQNLVTAMITRREDPFNEKEIFEATKKNLKKSYFEEKECYVKTMVMSTIKLFEMSGCIHSTKGVYQNIKVL